MTNEELKQEIILLAPGAVFDETGQWLTAKISSEHWLTLAKQLNSNAQLQFNYLFMLTCIDWKTHLEMAYHLRSTIANHRITVKCHLPVGNPCIDSVTSVWKTADFNEREVYEMFGVDFTGHPDLRLLILPDGWEGRNPMRKDFEDPVNMIRL